MKNSIKKLLSIVSIASVISTTLGTNIVSAQTILSPYNENSRLEIAGTEAETGKYATNPNDGVGKEATIKIDGDFSDWSDDMLIAQGAAWDVANHWKGGHENCILDSYSLYAAWDDENLYIGWQMVNTTDTWNLRDGETTLMDRGKIGNVPLAIALDVGNSTKMTGKETSGEGVWGPNITYDTRVDHILMIHGDGTKADCAMFTGNADGVTSQKDPELCHKFVDNGIEFELADGCLPKTLIGLNASSDPKDIYDPNADWVDFLKISNVEGKSRPHDTKYDTFYEMKIPFKALGIDKAYLEKNGIGCMQLATRGQSALDCLPHDPSMIDNVMGDYAKDPSTSHEKDDEDIITVPLASIGKLRQPGTGPVDPPVSKDPKITKFEADKEDVKAGDEVKFTCTASNATSYEFTIDGKAVDESEVSKNVLTHAFDEAGTYEVEVTAKGASGTKDATEKLEVKVSGSEENPEFEITNFVATPKNTCKVGEEVKLSARADGEDYYAYKFTVVDEDDNETVIKDYSSKENTTWTPEEEGTYTLRVYAKVDGAEDKDAKTKEVKDFKVTAKSEEEDKLTMDSFTADVKEGEIETGKEVNFMAEAS